MSGEANGGGDGGGGGRRTAALAVVWAVCTFVPVVGFAVGLFYLFDEHGTTAVAVNIPGQLIALGLALGGGRTGRRWRLAAAVVVAVAAFVVAGELAGPTAL